MYGVRSIHKTITLRLRPIIFSKLVKTSIGEDNVTISTRTITLVSDPFRIFRPLQRIHYLEILLC